MREILKKVKVHVPYGRLREELLNWVIGERINPEIGFNHIDLDRFRDADYRATADRLSDAGLSVTFHAPFMDLRPGAVDPSIRRLTLERLRRVFDLVPWFRPLSVVCHPSFDSRYYASVSRQWLDNSLETWRTLLSTLRGTGTIIALENVYETGPDQLRPLIDSLDSPQVRFCFDTGHANTFGRVPPADWMDAWAGYSARSICTTTMARPMSICRWGKGASPLGNSWGSSVPGGSNRSSLWNPIPKKISGGCWRISGR
jgi:hypothetical protein